MTECDPSLLLATAMNSRVIQVVAKTCAAQGCKAYLGGGAVRDLLRGVVTVADYDFYVETTQDILKAIKLEIAAALRNNSTAESSMEDYDIIACRSAKQYVSQFDFTINSILFDLTGQSITSPTGGLEALSQKKIRLNNRTTFVASPIAFIRAFRFAAAFQFSIEPETLETIKLFHEMVHLADGPHRSRITAEMFKLFSLDCSSIWHELSCSGVIESIFPYLLPLKHVPYVAGKPVTTFDFNCSAILQSQREYENCNSQTRSWLQEMGHHRIIVGNDRLVTRANRLSILRFSLLFQNLADSYVQLEPEAPAQFKTGEFLYSTVRKIAKIASEALLINPYQSKLIFDAILLAFKSGAALRSLLQKGDLDGVLIQTSREEKIFIYLLLIISLENRQRLNLSEAGEEIKLRTVRNLLEQMSEPNTL